MEMSSRMKHIHLCIISAQRFLRLNSGTYINHPRMVQVTDGNERWFDRWYCRMQYPLWITIKTWRFAFRCSVLWKGWFSTIICFRLSTSIPYCSLYRSSSMEKCLSSEIQENNRFFYDYFQNVAWQQMRNEIFRNRSAVFDKKI